MEHFSVTEVTPVVPLGRHCSQCPLEFFKNTSLEQTSEAYKCILRRLLHTWIIHFNVCSWWQKGEILLSGAADK